MVQGAISCSARGREFFHAYQGIKIAYQGIKVVYQGTAFLRPQRREGESETDSVIEKCRSPSVRRSS
jgi:hypothetical protein